MIEKKKTLAGNVRSNQGRVINFSKYNSLKNFETIKDGTLNKRYQQNT